MWVGGCDLLLFLCAKKMIFRIRFIFDVDVVCVYVLCDFLTSVFFCLYLD